MKPLVYRKREVRPQRGLPRPRAEEGGGRAGGRYGAGSCDVIDKERIKTTIYESSLIRHILSIS